MAIPDEFSPITRVCSVILYYLQVTSLVKVLTWGTVCVFLSPPPRKTQEFPIFVINWEAWASLTHDPYFAGLKAKTMD